MVQGEVKHVLQAKTKKLISDFLCRRRRRLLLVLPLLLVHIDMMRIWIFIENIIFNLNEISFVLLLLLLLLCIQDSLNLMVEKCSGWSCSGCCCVWWVGRINGRAVVPVAGQFEWLLIHANQYHISSAVCFYMSNLILNRVALSSSSISAYSYFPDSPVDGHAVPRARGANQTTHSTTETTIA